MIRKRPWFFRVVRLKERKLQKAFQKKEREEKNKDVAFLCGVEKRRFQQLYREYKMTREDAQNKKHQKVKDTSN